MGNNPKEIFLVGGARPNFMKIAPIARELDKYRKEFVYKIIHTGQHYDREMSEVFFKELGIRKSDRFLGVGSSMHARPADSEDFDRIRGCMYPGTSGPGDGGW